MKEALEALTERMPGADILRNANMSEYTSFKTGGCAEALMNAKSEEEVLLSLELAEELGICYTVIGNATNLLISDRGIKGLVIRIADGLSGIERIGSMLYAKAGTPLIALANASLDMGLMGLEWAAGIPGSVGGAVAMNAGAYISETSAVLTRVRYIEAGTMHDEKAETGSMGYRKSPYRAPGRIVLGAEFTLSEDDGGARERAREFNRKRREKQPVTYPSAGSVFKRPEGRFAGALIEEAGLKGMRIGGAEVSTLHAGFIINVGGATSGDVYALIRKIQSRVYEKSGVMLEPELMLLGEFED